jgi:hypothetical protein
MSTKPLPSIEELLSIATEVQKKRRRVENHPNVVRFLDEMQWDAGVEAIPTYVIFWYYRVKWDGSDRHYKAKKITFFRTFNKRFPEFRKSGQRYYLLKEGTIEINEEVLKEAALYDKKFWGKKTNRKKEDHALQFGNLDDEETQTDEEVQPSQSLSGNSDPEGIH